MDPERLAAVRATGLLDTAAEEPFDRLAALAGTVLETPLAFITLVDERRSFWKSCIGVAATDPAERQNLVEESFCQYVIGAGEELIVGDAAADPRTRDNPSIKGMGIAAWAGFPLYGPHGDILGTFCVVDTRPRDWTPRDVEVLRTLSQAASGEVALRAAVAEGLAAAAKAGALARTLQDSLLPPRLPEVEGLEVAASYRAAGEGVDVVGDFYDVFQTASQRWHVVIGDVCGKGVHAAKVTAIARWAVRAVTMRSDSSGEPLRQLNELLLQEALPDEPFLTAIHGVLSPNGTGFALDLACAGHPPAIVRRAGGRVEALKAGGTVLGLFTQAPVAEMAVQLSPGDTLVLYTDGVTEARTEGAIFGEERLEGLVAGHDGDAQGLALAIAEAVEDFSAGPLADDSAVLVVHVPDPA